MAEPTYVNVTETDFRDKLEAIMGFEQVRIQGTSELVFERSVILSSGNTGYKIRVYSSVAYGQTRDVGEDAIRVQLIDESTDRPVRVHGEKKGHKVGKRINRTAPTGIPEDERVGALLGRVRDRCADFWAYVRDNRCTSCGDGIMTPRQGKHGKFRGCSNYPNCTHTEAA